MAENSRMSKLSEKDDECVFTWKIFTGWDYMIGNAETAHNRVASLILGFKEALLEETERKKDKKHWKVLCLRVLVSFLVIGLLVFSAYIVFVVVDRSTKPEANSNWWRQNEITVSVSIISLIFPIFFEALGLLEGYHPRKSLRIQLARIMVLNLLNLYTLIFSQFWKISDMTIELQNLKKNYSILVPPTTILETVSPICIYVPVDCSTLSSSSSEMSFMSTPTTTSSLFNDTINIPILLDNLGNFNNITNFFGFPGVNFTNFEQLFNVSDLITNSLNLTTLLEPSSISTDILSFTPSTLSDTYTSSTNKMTSSGFEDDVSTESTDDSSTIPYLFTIIAQILRQTVSSSKTNVTSTVKNVSDSSNMTDFLLEEDFRMGNVSPTGEINFSGTDERTSEVTYTVNDITKSRGTSGLCYVKKCDEDMRMETRRQQQDLIPFYDMETRKRLRTLCWETMFGQELVKLTVMDLMLTIVWVLMLDFLRAILVRGLNNCWCWDLEKKFPQYGDFKIAENILHLVYNQGMVWMGMFFSPGLPAINLIKLVVMMYLRSWAVLTCNVPHQVVFRASRSNNFYLALLLTMLFLCVLPVGFAIVWIEPSWHCGPFSDYERIYHLFTKTLQKALPKTLHKAFDYIASPGIIIPLLMLLVLIIYYLVSLTNSLREANNDLKIQLRRERTEERRKMFQLVNKRVRKESKDSETPFAKWKKLLPELTAKQITLVNDVEKGEKNENEVTADLKKEINRKELLSRLMKKALRKSSGTSDEDIQFQDDPEEYQQDFFFEEKDLKKKNSSNRSKKRDHKDQIFEKSKSDFYLSTETQNITKIRKSQSGSLKTSRSGDVNKHESKGIPQRNSLPENIPVIKISKIESQEYLLNGDSGKDEEVKRGKARFIAAVDKYIKMSRVEKDKLSEGLNKKAKETTDKSKGRKVPVEHKGKSQKDVHKGKEKIRKKNVDVEEKKCPIAVEEIVPKELELNKKKLSKRKQNSSK